MLGLGVLLADLVPAQPRQGPHLVSARREAGDTDGILTFGVLLAYEMDPPRSTLTGIEHVPDRLVA